MYAWDEYCSTIRKLQPNTVINVCGPDVRWCGNEAGHCRKSEWSVVPAKLLDVEKIQDESQKVDDGEFSKKVNTRDEDLGSRDIIENADQLVWFPAEVNTSIRPGWFYHTSEDDKVRGLEELLNIYYGSVGGNSCFLLNLPPDRRGLIHENDVARLKELGDAIKEIFSENLSEKAKAEASATMDNDHCINNIFNSNTQSFWCPKEGTESAEIIIDLNEIKTFNKIVLMEHIKSGQRIEKFVLELKEEDGWKQFYEGTIVGYKRICRFDNVTSRYVKLKIVQSRWCPTLSYLGIY